MKGLFNLVKRFFFPPAGSPAWRRVLPYAVLGILTILILSGGAYGWEYTNRPGSHTARPGQKLDYQEASRGRTPWPANAGRDRTDSQVDYCRRA